jgi:hypothetical protein
MTVLGVPRDSASCSLLFILNKKHDIFTAYDRLIKSEGTRATSPLDFYLLFLFSAQYSRYNSEGVAESQTFRDIHILPKWLSYETADVDGKPIAVWSQSISEVRALYCLVAFYDTHGRKGEVLFCSRAPHETFQFLSFETADRIYCVIDRS